MRDVAAVPTHADRRTAAAVLERFSCRYTFVGTARDEGGADVDTGVQRARAASEVNRGLEKTQRVDARLFASAEVARPHPDFGGVDGT